MAKKNQTAPAPQTIGEILKEHVLEGTTQDALAKAMGVSRLTINQLINGKRSVTAEMSVRLGRVLSTSPGFWLTLQNDIDLAKAQQELEDILPTLEVLRKPVRQAR